jgi:hypothetical protein
MDEETLKSTLCMIFAELLLLKGDYALSYAAVERVLDLLGHLQCIDPVLRDNLPDNYRAMLTAAESLERAWRWAKRWCMICALSAIMFSDARHATILAAPLADMQDTMIMAAHTSPLCTALFVFGSAVSSTATPLPTWWTTGRGLRRS